MQKPINAFVARGSRAEESFRSAAGIAPEVARSATPEVIAPGIQPSPDHDLLYYGGKTIAHLTFTNLYVGGAESWLPGDVRSIDASLSAAMSDPALDNVMAQYFTRKPVSTFKPSRFLPGTRPAVFSQGDVEKLLADLHDQGALKGFRFGSTVFNFMLPSGTVLNTSPKPTPQKAAVQMRSPNLGELVEDKEDSLNGLGGYHGSIHVQSGRSKTTLYYAVGVYSEMLLHGRMNGIPVFSQPWKNVVATFYHELNEARTDPDVADAIAAGNDPSATKFLGWVSDQGEECGDYPVFEADPLTQVFQEVKLAGGGTAPVQFQYSNAVHGPEGPIATAHHRASRVLPSGA